MKPDTVAMLLAILLSLVSIAFSLWSIRWVWQ